VNPELKLCYIDGAWAYFTSLPIPDQIGDDWNDAPYECNAGAPYGWSEHDAKLGRKPWEIVKLAYDSPKLETPAEHANGISRYSVDQINAGIVPWLATYWGEKPPIKVMAGASVFEFSLAVVASGGNVYWPIDKISSEGPQ
jgi:hypothetical protein